MNTIKNENILYSRSTVLPHKDDDALIVSDVGWNIFLISTGIAKWKKRKIIIEDV